jgi:nitrate reductase cytochrome c-type subunit
MKAALIILFSIGFLQSCEYNQIKSVPGSSNNVLATNPDTKLDFAFVSSQVKVCLDCHSAGKKQPELSSRQALIDNAADVLSEVNSDSMPPTSKGYVSFTACQKAALQKWFDLGSPDDSAVNVDSIPACATEVPPVVVNPPTEPPVVNPPVTEAMINFAYVQSKTAVCLDCHSAGKKNPELTSKQALIDQGEEILSEVLSESMPPKKKGYTAFTACEKAALQKWYDLGFPDDSAVTVNSLVECAVAPPVVVTPPVTEPPITENMIDFTFVQTKTAVCLDCHSAGQERPELTTKQSLINKANDIMIEVFDESMPAQKKGYAAFTACEKAALQKWFDLGSPDTSSTKVNSLPDCFAIN